MHDSQPPPNIQWHSSGVAREHIEARLRQKGAVIWLTGLSGAGKSTIARNTQRNAFDEGHLAVVLDGDHVRNGLCSDLTFSPEDRAENVRRVAHVARLFADFGLIVIVSLISPYRRDRQRAREICAPTFLEVFVNASLETCEIRDPKGLYQKARAGQIAEFTGISAPYEAPEKADIVLDSQSVSEAETTKQLLRELQQRGIIRAKRGWASP